MKRLLLVTLMVVPFHALAVPASIPLYDLVTRECHPTGKLYHGAPAVACEYKVWLVGMSQAKCWDSRLRVRRQLRGWVADSLEFLCLPEDDE